MLGEMSRKLNFKLTLQLYIIVTSAFFNQLYTTCPYQDVCNDGSLKNIFNPWFLFFHQDMSGILLMHGL